MVLSDRNINILDRRLDLCLQQVVVSLKGLVRSLLGPCSLSVLLNALWTVGLAEDLVDWNLMPISGRSGDQRSSDDGNGRFGGRSMVISGHIIQVGEDRNCYFFRRMFIMVILTVILTVGLIVMRVAFHPIEADGPHGLGDHNSDWVLIVLGLMFMDCGAMIRPDDLPERVIEIHVVLLFRKVDNAQAQMRITSSKPRAVSFLLIT